MFSAIEKAIQAIKEATQPITLNLSNTNISDKQIKQLLQSIEKSKFPISLSLKFPHHPNDDPRNKVVSVDNQIFNNIKAGKLTSLTVKQQLSDSHKTRIKQIIDESNHSIIFRSIGLTIASDKYVEKLLEDSVSENTNDFDLSELSITDSQFELVLNAIQNSKKPVNLKISSKLYDNNKEAITNAIKEINAKVMAVGPGRLLPNNDKHIEQLIDYKKAKIMSAGLGELWPDKIIISDKHIEKLINDQKSENTRSLDLSEASLTDSQYEQIKKFINDWTVKDLWI
ncbi:hypothetical protein [Rickettsiales endosymbiont of Trichoplax sp. H2]|uniref:hypothetical protein n=1 Tax=Rickettsiales endosymbiont of Trichoplax sp. H2 TaxID=2021221 RepID=UPI0012B27BC5|nr:hypothetical protein [Rickettsiales endosymbiont of Trichoplax sp. H2]MSO14222.1 hypothetical protein [Rickettsiales endosymbiont of Trichoplax sp. H2]